MADDLNSRLKQVIENKGLSLDAASRQAGMERSYFSKLFDGAIGHPRIDTVRKIAQGLGVSPDWLMNGVGDLPPPVDVRNHGPGSTPLMPHRDEMPNDMPVMGTAAGNHLRGAFKLGSDAVDYVRRPPALMRNKDAYALYVEGSSMEPQFFSGDLIFVNPNRPARLGDVVVIQLIDDDGGVEGTLGIFKKRTETSVVIGKRNPAADVEIKRTARMEIHKVLSNNELFGI
jgi:SOS-response transcriptional repressor LexA